MNYKSLQSHYEDCFKKHGDTSKGVDWPSETDATLRHRVMLDVIQKQATQIQPVSLLDFGCGAAHLYETLQKQNRKSVEYSGVDISKVFIDHCKKKYPELSFQCLDLLQDEVPTHSYDYVVANGVFTEKRDLSQKEMLEFVGELLPKIFSMARVGIAVNFMSEHVDWKREDLFHFPFDEFAKLAQRSLSRHYRIRADYGLYEYTAYIYRQPQGL